MIISTWDSDNYHWGLRRAFWPPSRVIKTLSWVPTLGIWALMMGAEDKYFITSPSSGATCGINQVGDTHCNNKMNSTLAYKTVMQVMKQKISILTLSTLANRFLVSSPLGLSWRLIELTSEMTDLSGFLTNRLAGLSNKVNDWTFKL